LGNDGVTFRWFGEDFTELQISGIQVEMEHPEEEEHPGRGNCMCKWKSVREYSF
jgi:hypothetical protein